MRTLVVGQRVAAQLIRDRRLLALSVLAPLVIIYLLKVFFDTLPPTFDAARYAVPIAAFLVHFLSFLLCMILVVVERTEGTLERMFINGYRRTQVIGGYLVGYLALATLQAVAAVVEVLLLFHLSYSAIALVWIGVVVWLLAVASVMLGIFVSTFARTTAQVFPFIPLIILPSFFLSGLLVNITALPLWAQGLGHILPLFYANRVILTLIAPGGSVESVWGDLVVLAGYSLVLLLLASRTLRETE